MLRYKAKHVLDNIAECNKRYPEKMRFSALSTIYYDNVNQIEVKLDRKYDECEISVENCDTIVAGKTLKDAGFNPVCMNMASAFKPGGGWRSNARAQEESLFYRSTMAVSLEDCLSIRHRNFYPMSPLGAIYSPNILVFKDEHENLLEWDECFYLDFIAIAALRKPILDDKNRLSPHDFKVTEQKIEGFFRIAYEQKHDALVLGALGCGAYSNPPHEIAKIFKKCLARWKPYFRKIVFAIINDRNGRQNFELFSNLVG